MLGVLSATLNCSQSVGASVAVRDGLVHIRVDTVLKWKQESR